MCKKFDIRFKNSGFISVDYFDFKVTNPPIDPFREKMIMSLASPVGPAANLLEPSGDQCKRLYLSHPILSSEDIELIQNTEYHGWKVWILNAFFKYYFTLFFLLFHAITIRQKRTQFSLLNETTSLFYFVTIDFVQSQVVDTTYPVSDGVPGLVKAIDRICAEACAAAKSGYNFIILSDRGANKDRYCTLPLPEVRW